MSKSVAWNSTIVAHALGLSIATLAVGTFENCPTASSERSLTSEIPVAERIVAVGKFIQGITSDSVPSQWSDFSNFSDYSKSG